MDAQTVKAYDARAADFAARHGAADASELQRILLKHLPAGGRVLEIGCGCGRDALFLAEHGFRVVATDASTGMLESFRKSAGDQVRIVDYAADRARTPATVSGSAQRKTVSTKSGDYE